MLLTGIRREVGNWEEELRWAMRKIKGKFLISIVLSTAWKAFIYHVWRERNRRMHLKPLSSAMQILKQIKEEISIRLVGIKKAAVDDVNSMLKENWGLLTNICV